MVGVLQLTDTCLKSTHIPAYLAAAFAKKLGRLALSAPPSGALVVIAMIHNLLRRHPSINHLVHRVSSSRPCVRIGQISRDFFVLLRYIFVGASYFLEIWGFYSLISRSSANAKIE